MPKDDDSVYLYRGVHAKHPMLEAARRGIVIPGKRDSGVTPEMHNRGGWESQSPYTSWTYDFAVAKEHAMEEGSGYVILRLRKDDPLPGDEWRWEESPNTFFEVEESEVLLLGVRMDAEVLPDE